MSIQEITPHTSHIKVDDCRKEPAFRLIKADINFLWDKFTDGMNYPDDFNGNRDSADRDYSDIGAPTKSCNLKSTQEPTPTDIRYYSDIEALTKSYNFAENGFQYCKLEEGSPLTSAIERNAKDLHTGLFSMEEESKLFSSQVEQFLSSWGKANKISGIPVVIDSAYRSSDPASSSSRGKPFFLAHVDFSKEELMDPLSHRGNAYKVGAEKVFGKMSNEDYKKIQLHPFNIWVPLHQGSHNKGSNNMLAVMNTASDENLPGKLRPVSTTPGIIFSLHPNKRQEWVAANLTLRDRTVILFDTTRTPHTAINIEEIPESPRTSMEFRVGFFSRPE